jgi:hypothetical protein
MTLSWLTQHAISSEHRARLGIFVLMLAAAAALSGCANRAALRAAEDLAHAEEFKNRRAGEHPLASAEDVQRHLRCGERRAVLAQFDSGEVIPVRPTSGREINHRVVYSACAGAGEPLTGTLTRRLYYGRQQLFETKEQVTLKPGRWALDVFIGIPPETNLGWYAVEAVFEVDAPYVYLYDWRDFQVVEAGL